ncbi:CBS domain-containing protein [Flavobacterium algicola]|uniref:CBS domain-containing protein n=1 Tax=Flavobacterium algicola TaxID=556529 RepID=UPI001EFDF50C|nr:CBS domain-containing protein [Flavobacterium algicola]MCG9791511.1 CBS domain-containing protein [Flavobacterium algicola]
MTVNQILSVKGGDVFSIVSTISVYDALKVMGEKNVGALLVIDNKEIVGILSERDYARKIVLKNKTSKDTLVHEIMGTGIITVKLSDNIDYCMGLMSGKRIRHLPVVDGDAVLGVISIGDVVKAIIESQKETINHLDSYINGTQI